MTIAAVPGSASNASIASMCVVPMIGSPPMPIAVEKPMSRSSYIIWYVSVPDLDTRPIGPGLVMSAGMMPAFDFPGLISPGQFGPTIRVVPRSAYAQNVAVSCTGMPSVMTTQSGIDASTASITASLVNRAGTNTTVTSAPVSSMASRTVPNTGIDRPSKSAFSPALRGLTPPTMFVPDASMRVVCRVPSAPVMPWTMTLECSFKKMLICSLRRRRSLSPSGSSRQLGGAIGRVVHRVDLLDGGQRRVAEDAPAQFGVVAVEPDDQRLVDGVAALLQQLERGDDAVRHRVAGGDAAEHVHEHGPDARVGQDDLQAVGHHLGRRAAADVEEVRRLDALPTLQGIPLSRI